jgi:hypothetical protein
MQERIRAGETSVNKIVRSAEFAMSEVISQIVLSAIASTESKDLWKGLCETQLMPVGICNMEIALTPGTILW